MDSFETNKIVGAVLGVVFLMFGGSLLAEGIFHSEVPETPGYEIVVAEASEGGAGGEEAAAVVPIAARLQDADPAAGESQFRRCVACHSADAGGENKIGPGLYEVVDRPIASHEGFDYSAAMSEFSEGGSVVWDYEHLDGFLENPSGYMPGTKMGFAGIRDPQDRADTVAYLRSLAATPAPLPEAPVEEAATEDPAVDAPGATTQTGESSDQINAQAPGMTDSDAGSALPGQQQAPVASESETPDPLARQVQDANIAEDAADGESTTDQGEAGAPAAAEPGAEEPAAEAVPAEDDAAANVEAPADEAAASEAGGEQQVAQAAPAAVEAAAPAVSGDPAAGERVYNRCRACHAVGEGAVNKIGPELNGIVGEAIASVEGYNFSQGLQDYAAEHPTWTVEELTAWLTNPKAVVPGTKMAFAGLRNPDEVANVIAYLAQFGEDGTISGN